MTATLDDVPVWAVLYAIRYGIHRQTYAFGDACDLTRRYWPQLAQHHRTIMDDLMIVLQAGMLPADSARRAAELLAWCGEQK